MPSNTCRIPPYNWADIPQRVRLPSGVQEEDIQQGELDEQGEGVSVGVSGGVWGHVCGCLWVCLWACL